MTFEKTNTFTTAVSLVERANELPSILDRIETLEAELKPLQDEIKANKETLKAFLNDAELSEFTTDNGFMIRFIDKVRKNLNVDLVQKAVSKTMWNRITAYVDPNSGKKPKKAYTETTFKSFEIKKVEVDAEVPTEADVSRTT